MPCDCLSYCLLELNSVYQFFYHIHSLLYILASVQKKKKKKRKQLIHFLIVMFLLHFSVNPSGCASSLNSTVVFIMTFECQNKKFHHMVVSNVNSISIYKSIYLLSL